MEYPSNKFNQVGSSAPQKEEKKVVKVVDGNLKKRSGLSKLKDAFRPEDVASVKEHIFCDIIPNYLKKAADDVLTTLIWGNNASSRSSNRGSQPSYRDYYDSKRSSSQSSRISTVYTFDYVELGSIGDANAVLDSLNDIIVRYGAASVSDLYDLVGKTGNYQDCKYGWFDLRTAKIERTREGTYLVVCPRPVPLNN